jgi:hypothetical protein
VNLLADHLAHRDPQLFANLESATSWSLRFHYIAIQLRQHARLVLGEESAALADCPGHRLGIDQHLRSRGVAPCNELQTGRPLVPLPTRPDQARCAHPRRGHGDITTSCNLTRSRRQILLSLNPWQGQLGHQHLVGDPKSGSG